MLGGAENHLHTHTGIGTETRGKGAGHKLQKNDIPWRFSSVQFSPVQSLSHVRLLAIPWTAAHQASLSLTISWSSPKFVLIELVILSNHLILCHLLLLLPSIFPSIRVFFNELALHIRWPKYQSFSFSFSPSKEYSWVRAT